MKNYVRAISVAIAAVSLCAVSSLSAVAVEPSSTEQQALTAFKANLDNPKDLQAFEALDSEQKNELASYLLGEIDPFAEAEKTGVEPKGQFEVVTDEVETAPVLSKKLSGTAARAASTTKTVSAWQSFTFAGVTISKTTVRMNYTVSGGSAKKVSSYSCVVNANYDPFAEVHTSKDGSWVSGGKATAECLVKVKRGTPTPWGQVTWSTKSNVQYVTGNGRGSVTSHGWR